MTSLTILGSTGSIGVSTLRVLRSLGDEFRVQGFGCKSNLRVLEEQISEFSPAAVAVSSAAALASPLYREIRQRHPGIEFLEGDAGVAELVKRDADILVSAIVGAAGLLPTLAAIPHVKRIALANKETLVMAGDLFMEQVRDHGVELIPVDSEHSALFMLLEKLDRRDVRRILLTASGGSLRGRSREELRTVTPVEALAHPTWDMGSKITIDSASLMNKGFEVIEAHHLFGIDYGDIDVVIHPESVIHSMVETRDGAVYAHLGVTDMALPILNALLYPEKRENPFGRLDLFGIGGMHFMRHDAAAFPALDLCYRAGRRGGTLPAVLNAANEVCVEAFLREAIPFTGIAETVERVMGGHDTAESPLLHEILEADRWARARAMELIAGNS
jgi:1-deoxy-D-xylulose-5-phosphate reductoisomerase